MDTRTSNFQCEAGHRLLEYRRRATDHVHRLLCPRCDPDDVRRFTEECAAADRAEAARPRLRITLVDMDGFCGRDHHPDRHMVGEIVTVLRTYLDGPYPEEGSDDDIPVRVYECERADGSRVDLVEFEVEEVE